MCAGPSPDLIVVLVPALRFDDASGQVEVNEAGRLVVKVHSKTYIPLCHYLFIPQKIFLFLESLRQQIDHWLEQRVVEESDSPWSFPLVPVLKKNGKEIRWTVDYCWLNVVTKKDAFLLPNISDNLSRLSGSRVFSALDGAGAFHAIPVWRADREKIAFSSPFGQCQFIKMPFGLANAPATYSRLVAKAFCHIPSS